MRIASLLLSIIAIPVSCLASTICLNFRLCTGYDLYDGVGWAYPRFTDGQYVTISLAEANSRNWKHNYTGDFTDLSGSYTTSGSHPLPSFYAAVYLGGNFFLADDQSLEIPFDVPYSGGTGPQNASGANGNTAYYGSGNGGDFFGVPPSSSAGLPSVSDGTADFPYIFYGLSSDGAPVRYSAWTTDGQSYFQVGDGVAAPVDSLSQLPVYGRDSGGSTVSGYWDALAGSFSSGGGSGGDGGSGVDVSGIISAVNSQGELSRAQLVQLLGSAGNSWVYDCKLSLSQLYSLAIGQGLITRPQIDLSNIQSSLNTIASKPNVDISGLAKDSTLSTVNTSVGQANTTLTSIETELKKLTDTTVPVLPSNPNFGDSTPDEELPWNVDGFNDSVAQSFGDLVSWGDSGAPVAFKFDFVSGLLTRMIGQIPSVGSDPQMFQVQFELPIIGSVNRQWSFADFPYIGEFRSFLLWVIYVFFALACFKLLHATII